MELLGILLAGLGLYFGGLKEISRQVNNLTGHKLRLALARATQSSFRASLLGMIAGAITQSTVAMLFMSMSMVKTGVLDIRRALIITSWAGIGTSALVLMASFDTYLVNLYLLGIVGICFFLNLDENERYRYLLRSLFGLSLLFMGLSMLKSVALPLSKQVWVADFLMLSLSATPLILILGVILGILLQSAMTVSIIAVTLTSVGLLNLDQGLIIVCGSNVGSVLAIIISNRSLRGTSRQILLVRWWSVLIGMFMMLSVLFIDIYTALPSLQTALTAVGFDIATSLAVGYLLLQIGAALALSIFGNPLMKLAKRTAPPDPKEELSKPLYISARNRVDPEASVDLLEKEIERLIIRLPSYLDTLRAEEDRPASVYSSAVLHAAGSSVLNETTQMIKALMSSSLSYPTLERLLNVQARNDLLKHLQDSCFELEEVLAYPFPEEFTQQLSGRVIEGLHAVLSVLTDTVTEQDDPDMLLIMSSDRSGLMEKIRAQMQSSHNDLSEVSRTRLFAATTLFERTIWLVNRYGKLIERATRNGVS